LSLFFLGGYFIRELLKIIRDDRLLPLFGVLAQLVERYNGIVEVIGSTPLHSIFVKNSLLPPSNVLQYTIMSKNTISLLIFLGAILLGVATPFLGFFPLITMATITSEIFLRLLQFLSLPLIFLAILSTISGMKDAAEMHFLGKRVLFYTLGTTILAASIALLLFVTIDPVQYVPLAQATSHVIQEANQTSYLSHLVQVFPSNIFGMFIDGNVLGIVLMGALLSLSILLLPQDQKESLHHFFSSLFAAFLKMTHIVLMLMPLAIWAFATLFVVEMQTHSGEVQGIAAYIACVVGANLIQGFIVIPALLLWKKVSPYKAAKQMLPALSMAFFSKSSGAALPITLECVENRVGVSKKVAGFSIPLCSVINMNGCAAFILTTVLFVSGAHGVTFPPLMLVAWIFLATCAAVGNAGVPMGCYFLSSAFLLGMDIPLYMMGLILPFYTLIDMIETALNVWSDAAVTISVDRDLETQAEKIHVSDR
jgi:Na+/H+-dicarboxylate symporter